MLATLLAFAYDFRIPPQREVYIKVIGLTKILAIKCTNIPITLNICFTR